jgi:phage internal scaffolding protein
MKFKKAYDSVRYQTVMSGESLTEQSHKASTDINNIVNKYARTGVLEHRNEYRGEYGFCDGKTFQEAMFTVQKARDMFNELPSHVRQKFDQNPAKFLDFVQNPENAKQMVEMGLATSTDDIASKTIQKDRSDVKYEETPPNPDGGKPKP